MMSWQSSVAVLQMFHQSPQGGATLFLVLCGHCQKGTISTLGKYAFVCLFCGIVKCFVDISVSQEPLVACKTLRREAYQIICDRQRQEWWMREMEKLRREEDEIVNSGTKHKEGEKGRTKDNCNGGVYTLKCFIHLNQLTLSLSVSPTLSFCPLSLSGCCLLTDVWLYANTNGSID